MSFVIPLKQDFNTFALSWHIRYPNIRIYMKPPNPYYMYYKGKLKRLFNVRHPWIGDDFSQILNQDLMKT